MINRFKDLLKKAVKKTDDIVVNMDGGVGGLGKSKILILNVQLMKRQFLVTHWKMFSSVRSTG